MPAFTAHTPYLRENGPICNVVFKPSDKTVAQLRLEKKDVPFVNVRALIDTGAQTTAVSQEVVDRLKLVSRGTAKIFTSAKTPELRHEYDVSLEFDYDTYLSVLRVIGANLKDHSIDCLIGRDVLQYGQFHYDGPGKRFTLSFNGSSAAPSRPDGKFSA